MQVAKPGRIRPWSPAQLRYPGLPSEFRPQMGIAPVVLTVGRVLLPWVVAGGAIYVGGRLLKDELGVQTSHIPQAALTGGLGAAAFVSASMIPEDWRALAYVLGVAGSAASIYFLFTPPPAPPPPSPVPGILPRTAAPGTEVPREAAGYLAGNLEVALDPLQETTGGTTRSTFTQQEYAFSVRNDYGRNVQVFAGLAVYDSSQKLLFSSPPLPTVIGRKLLAIPAGGAISEILVAPRIFVWLPQTVTVEIQLFRNRDDREPVVRSEAIPIKLNPVG